MDSAPCQGTLSTDWTLGLNRKTAILAYRKGTVILDHSAQKVVIRGPRASRTVSLQNGTTRLTNQYRGVFQDLAQAFRAGKDNSKSMLRLHRLLFAAARA